MKKVVTVLIFSALGFGLYGQPNASFEKLEEKENVSIYYKWKKKFPYGKDAERFLVLYIDNETSKKLSVSFTVDIFKNAIKHSSSGLLNYCLPADYEIKGRFKDLAFDTGLSWEEMNNGVVQWEINQLKVQEIEGDCKSQSNWMTTK